LFNEDETKTTEMTATTIILVVNLMMTHTLQFKIVHMFHQQMHTLQQMMENMKYNCSLIIVHILVLGP